MLINMRPKPFFIFFLSTKHHCRPTISRPPAAMRVMAATTTTTTILGSTITNNNDNHKFSPPSYATSLIEPTPIRDFNSANSSGATLMPPTMWPTPTRYHIHCIIPKIQDWFNYDSPFPYRDHHGNVGETTANHLY